MKHYFLILALWVPAFSLPATEIKEKYHSDDIAKEFGPLLKTRNLSEDEQVNIHEKASFITWLQGPLKGHIFRIVTKGQDAVFNPPSTDDFFIKIYDLIDQYSESNKQPAYIPLDKAELGYRDEWAFGNEAQSEINDKAVRIIYETFESKYGDFYPRNARYFKWSNDAEKFIDLFSLINKLGIRTYLFGLALNKILMPKLATTISNEQDTPSKQLFEQYSACLQNAITQRKHNPPSVIIECKKKIISPNADKEPPQSLGLTPAQEKLNAFATLAAQTWYLAPSYITSLIDQAFGLDRYNKSKFREPVAMPKDLVLVHGTLSSKLPNIFQLGGIGAINYYSKKAIEKITGGEFGGSGGSDPHLVSFYTLKDFGAVNTYVPLGYAAKEGFEYPISLGVSNKNYYNWECYNQGNPLLKNFSQNDLKQMDQNRSFAREKLASVDGFADKFKATWRLHIFPKSLEESLGKYIKEQQLNTKDALSESALPLANIIAYSDESYIKFAPNPAHTTIGAERTVNQFFPLRCVDYLFVPPSAMTETESLVHDWRLPIKVLAFPIE